MDFRKYMHVERFGTGKVQGIELGTTYIFPKLDGTNASTWLKDGAVAAGSRNRELSLEEDNAGFLAHIGDDSNLIQFHKAHPNLRLYGEWLVPHSLKTYVADAWRQFYVFDVYNHELECYMPYEAYKWLLDDYMINHIQPIAIIKNATYEQLLGQMEKNVFLIGDGNGIGEGVVIKNYDYRNIYGDVCFAKLITNSFKANHTAAMGAPALNGKKMVEQEICDKYVTKHLVDKVYAKILIDAGERGWGSKYIPRLLGTVYHDLVDEEIWDAIKNMKLPTVNFKTLSILCNNKVKELKSELF